MSALRRFVQTLQRLCSRTADLCALPDAPPPSRAALAFWLLLAALFVALAHYRVCALGSCLLVYWLVFLTIHKR